jgi:hypothetical protein
MAVTTKHLINRAFKKLIKAGYFARQNFWCCQTCAWSAIPEVDSNKVVFYHRQDADRFKNTGELTLAWAGDGAEIVSILESVGLKVNWNGKEDTRISIVGMVEA